MARIRFIKPEFFDDPDVADLSMPARLFFIGLWVHADREGRLENDSRRLKAKIFPYDDLEISRLAVELHGKDMIRLYQDATGKNYIWIPKFSIHQRPHPKEAASVIPPCPDIAVKKNGSPLNLTASKPDSGLLILDSGVRTLDSGGRIPAATPLPPARRQTIVQPRRKDAAWEGPRVYVPQRLHNDFVALRNHPKAEQELFGWYAEVSDDWTTGIHATHSPGGEMFVFWRGRFNEKWPATKAPKRDALDDFHVSES